MKWIILFFFVACGKHQEPQPLDYRDSDGDQRLNYSEKGEDKYLANLEVLGKVNARLKFLGSDLMDLSLSNGVLTSPLEVLVSSESKLKASDFFSEWSDLKLEEKISSQELNKTSYHVQLEFAPVTEKILEVFLRTGRDVKSLGSWKQVMNLKLSANELRNILMGKSYFSLKKEYLKGKFFSTTPDQTILQKTYKIHFYDGKQSKLMYISRDLPFEDLMKEMNISALKVKNEKSFFYYSRQPGHSGWYAREFMNGDKSLVYATHEQISKSFYKNYKYQKTILARENGFAVSKIILKNSADANVFLRVRPEKLTERTFSESSFKREHGQRPRGVDDYNGNIYSCTHYLRNIADEKATIPDYSALLKNLNVLIFENKIVVDQRDDSGPFWEMELNTQVEDVELQLFDLGQDTYVTTGEYKNSCVPADLNRGKNPSYRTNREGTLAFAVESFVEKIE